MGVRGGGRGWGGGVGGEGVRGGGESWRGGKGEDQLLCISNHHTLFPHALPVSLHV